MRHVIRTMLVGIGAICAAVALPIAQARAMQSPAGARGGSTKAETIDACALLTPNEIRKLSGRDDVAQSDPEREPLPNGGSACVHSSPAMLAVSKGTPLITIQLLPLGSIESYTVMRTRLKAESLSGIGDDAFIQVREPRVTVVSVRVGLRHLTIQLEAVRPQTAASLRPAALALAKAAAQKLQ